MKKRDFLAGAVALGASAPALARPGRASAQSGAPASTPLVTISGAIDHRNRGPVDPALDQLFHKQLVKFDGAFAFDFGMLARLPRRRSGRHSSTMRSRTRCEARA